MGTAFAKTPLKYNNFSTGALTVSEVRGLAHGPRVCWIVNPRRLERVTMTTRSRLPSESFFSERTDPAPWLSILTILSV